ncbi:ATP-dependent DNA helicase RecQ [Hypsizygus marmoreus]|uniref:DNA 3'-5' helicase n=1 Tax=Hypsizygus marmoreus TaxID=39966 RepID=A0A369JHI6_HYPMA|nr:ATP-dependent DNA helicase RecQ [Hypsizygus marmoreus]
MARQEWTIKQIHDLVQAKFGKRACWLQVKIALALRAGKDVVGIAPTGAGKTLSFWIALLMALEEGEDKMIFVVTPLNLLGKQNVEALDKAGLKAIAVSRENATSETFKDIEAGKYHVVIINPELLMGNSDVAKLWTKPNVTKRILYFTFDEGHCISQWGKFWKEYLHVGDLRYLIPETIPFFVASATLPPAVLLDVVEILRLRPDKTEHITQSNDRPEIRLMVRGLTFPASSFRDLEFLIPKGFKEGDPPIQKFLIFFDNTKEAEAACRHLRTLLPSSLRKRLKYFHSTMTQAYRDEELVEMRDSRTWGLCCTDAFGMEEEGTAILLVEKKDTNEERIAKAERAAKRKERKKEGIGTKRKAEDQGKQRVAKCPALANRSLNRNIEMLDETDNGDEVRRESEDGLESEDDDDEDETVVTVVGSLMVDVEIEVDDATAAVEAFKDEHRTHYAQRRQLGQELRSSQRKGKARTGIEVGSPMDDFINAHVCIHCRRTVPQLYFGNDHTPTNQHILCDSTTEAGCSRCAPKVAIICCDLCDPEHFKQYIVPFEKQTRSSAKSNIKPFEMTPADHNLKTALFDWRRQHAVAKFGQVVVRRLGAKMLISDKIVERLVICAHAQKLPTVNDIVKETGWKRDWADELGESLLAVIHSYFPPPAAASSSSAPGVEQVMKRKPPKCSKCKAEGHIIIVLFVLQKG